MGGFPLQDSGTTGSGQPAFVALCKPLHIPEI